MASTFTAPLPRLFTLSTHVLQRCLCAQCAAHRSQLRLRARGPRMACGARALRAAARRLRGAGGAPQHVRTAVSATSAASDALAADCVVVGGGVVGLAIARALALAGREVLLLEAASALGTGTSSRSSEGAPPKPPSLCTAPRP